MANYSKNNFIVPVGDDSVELRIRDIKGQERHNVVNSKSTTFFNSNANVIIRTEGDNTDIILDFSSTVEAIQALVLLNKAYSKIKKNYETKKINNLIEDIGSTISNNVKDYIFSNESDANDTISNNQTVFQMPSNTVSIDSVYVNGVAINDYTFVSATKLLILDPVLIGYDIEGDDELLVKYV